MRTVTFSDPAIVKLLNDRFVCAWINKRPDLKFLDGLYGKEWRPRGLGNGAGEANVTSIFASSDGTVVHGMPGCLDATAFKKQAEFAFDLNARLSSSAIRREDRAGLYAEAHSKAAKSSKNDVEGAAHKMLAPRFMRVNEFRLNFFDGLGRAYV